MNDEQQGIWREEVVTRSTNILSQGNAAFRAVKKSNSKNIVNCYDSRFFAYRVLLILFNFIRNWH